MGKKLFLATTLDSKEEIFIVHTAALAISDTRKIHSSYKVQTISLQVNKALTTVYLKYSDFTDGFSLTPTTKLPNHTRINNNFINQVYARRSFYCAIYSLLPVELKTLKTYIKTYLSTANYLQISQFFFQKPDDSLVNVSIIGILII